MWCRATVLRAVRTPILGQARCEMHGKPMEGTGLETTRTHTRGHTTRTYSQPITYDDPLIPTDKYCTHAHARAAARGVHGF